MSNSSGRRGWERACSICGRMSPFKEMRYIGQSRWACSDDKDGLTAEQIDRHNAKARPLVVKSRSHPLLASEIPSFQHDEARVFNSPLQAGLVTSLRFFDVTSGDGAVLANVDEGAHNTSALVGPSLIGAMAWTIRWLAAIITEGARPAAWIAQARPRLRTLADALQAHQVGVGIVLAESFGNSVVYGCFARSESPTIDYDSIAYYATDCAVGGLAFLAAFAVLGDRKYLDYAKAAAHGLRLFQCSGICTIGSIPETYVGPWSNLLDFGDSNEYDGRFCVDSLVCLEFYVALQAVAGDFMIGPSGLLGGRFTRPPAALLSAGIASGRAFWENGAAERNGTVVNGLSVTTPRELFDTLGNKLDGDVDGSGNWEFVSGTSISGRRWAQAVSSLYAVDGLTDRVRALHDFLRSFSSNPTYETPAGTSAKTLHQGATGTFDANLALATLMDTATLRNGSSFYDWATVGLLAPVQSAIASGDLLRAKAELGKARRRWQENTIRDEERDTALERGKTGLTFQTSFTTDLSLAVFPFTATRRVHDAEAMAMAAMAYRYAPKITQQVR